MHNNASPQRYIIEIETYQVEEISTLCQSGLLIVTGFTARGPYSNDDHNQTQSPESFKSASKRKRPNLSLV